MKEKIIMRRGKFVLPFVYLQYGTLVMMALTLLQFMSVQFPSVQTLYHWKRAYKKDNKNEIACHLILYIQKFPRFRLSDFFYFFTIICSTIIIITQTLKTKGMRKTKKTKI